MQVDTGDASSSVRATQQRLCISTLALWARYVDLGGGLELDTVDRYLTQGFPIDPADVAVLDAAADSFASTASGRPV